MLLDITRYAYQMSNIREGKDLGHLCIFKIFSSRVLDSSTNLKV